MKFTLGEMELELNGNMLRIIAEDMWGAAAEVGLDRADTALLINELQAYLEQFEPDGENKVELKLESLPGVRYVSIVVRQPNMAIVMTLHKTSQSALCCGGVIEHLYKQHFSDFHSTCSYSPGGFCDWQEVYGYDTIPGSLRKFINDFLFKYDAQAVDINSVETFLNEV